jgi:hypothetical protein
MGLFIDLGIVMATLSKYSGHRIGATALLVYVVLQYCES